MAKFETGRAPRADTNHFAPSPEKSDLNIVYAYLSHIRSFPILSAEQERFLFQGMRDGQRLPEATAGLAKLAPDMEVFGQALSFSTSVRDLLVNCNLQMVFPIARKHYGLTLMDRVQEGNIGLIKAVDAYSPDHGSRFYNFAVNHVRGAVINSRHGERLISFPERVGEAVDKIWTVFDSYAQANHRPPTKAEWAVLVSQETELSRKQAADTISSVLLGRAQPISLDAVYQPGDLKVEDTIADDKAGDFPDSVDSRLDAQSAYGEIIARLTPQELEIIRQKYGLEGLEDTVLNGDIAAKMKRTRRRVLQIQQKAFSRLRVDQDLRALAEVS